MKWPNCSPDFNPIERLRSILARSAYADVRQYATAKDLKESVLSQWEKLDSNLSYKLVRTMGERCVKVLEKQSKKKHY